MNAKFDFFSFNSLVIQRTIFSKGIRRILSLIFHPPQILIYNAFFKTIIMQFEVPQTYFRTLLIVVLIFFISPRISQRLLVKVIQMSWKDFLPCLNISLQQ
jgi:hypothetical protein